MGRRGVSIHDEDRWVFNRLADAYVARPAYPRALVERLAALGGPRACELGAGTGLLAVALADAGLQVTAVEPARAMLDKLSDARVRKVHAAAESTGLGEGAFELVVLADAVQWVDPELAGAEVARLLARGGACAVVEPRFADTPFMRELAALLDRQNPKSRPLSLRERDRVRAPGHEEPSPQPSPEGRGGQLLSIATRGAPVTTEHFHDAVTVDLAAVLRSLSVVGGEKTLAEAQAIAARHADARWARDFTLSWSRKP